MAVATTATTPPTREDSWVIDPTPLTVSSSGSQIHEKSVNALVGLSDGSIVSCSQDRTAKRWLLRTTDDGGDNKTKRNMIFKHVGTFVHKSNILCVMEKDKSTIITGTFNGDLSEWNITTLQRVRSLSFLFPVTCLLRIRQDNSSFICCVNNSAEKRRLSDLGLVSNLFQHRNTVKCACELSDGTFLTGSFEIKRWDPSGKQLRSFTPHGCPVDMLIELNKDVIVSMFDVYIRLWKLSEAKSLGTRILHKPSCLIALSEDRFATASLDGLLVWDEKKLIQTIKTERAISTILRLRDIIITTTLINPQFEVRQLLK